MDRSESETGALEAKHWIVAAREGSDEALGRLMEFSRQYLLLIANEELDPELRAKGGASDLVQETQLEALRGFGTFRGTTARELLGWLRQMLLHNVRDFARRFTGSAKRQTGRELSLEGAASSQNLFEQLVGDDPSPNALLVRQERQELVEQALAQLPEDYRRVIEWHHREDCSFEEIAARLGRSAGAVRKLWFRAVARLQEQLQTDESR